VIIWEAISEKQPLGEKLPKSDATVNKLMISSEKLIISFKLLDLPSQIVKEASWGYQPVYHFYFQHLKTQVQCLGIS